jgi:hypothetical protein
LWPNAAKLWDKARVVGHAGIIEEGAQANTDKEDDVEKEVGCERFWENGSEPSYPNPK